MKSAPGYNIPYELFLISDAGEIFIEQEPIKFAGHTLAQWIIFTGQVQPQPSKKIAEGTYTDVAVVTIVY
ncbi:hypothetical protein BBC0178_011810 [Bartonella apihabitans]|uniref:Uncharacterized protein n=2 Tax=Bartonella apihabitans TaxID=2750929 RepID=A0A1U9MBI0_9HYPH|nr:hypothetical protein BBC0178_011810 [Bartonella apihabitans]